MILLAVVVTAAEISITVSVTVDTEKTKKKTIVISSDHNQSIGSDFCTCSCCSFDDDVFSSVQTPGGREAAPGRRRTTAARWGGDEACGGSSKGRGRTPPEGHRGRGGAQSWRSCKAWTGEIGGELLDWSAVWLNAWLWKVFFSLLDNTPPHVPLLIVLLGSYYSTYTLLLTAAQRNRLECIEGAMLACPRPHPVGCVDPRGGALCL